MCAAPEEVVTTTWREQEPRGTRTGVGGCLRWTLLSLEDPETGGLRKRQRIKILWGSEQSLFFFNDKIIIRDLGCFGLRGLAFRSKKGRGRGGGVL